MNKKYSNMMTYYIMTKLVLITEVDCLILININTKLLIQYHNV